MQTEFARDVGAKFGLRRGLDGSKAGHKTAKQYNAAMQQNPTLTPPVPLTPSLEEHEIATTMASVLKRAARRAAGEHDHYNGKDYDPRYNYSAESLRK